MVTNFSSKALVNLGLGYLITQVSTKSPIGPILLRSIDGLGPTQLDPIWLCNSKEIQQASVKYGDPVLGFM